MGKRTKEERLMSIDGSGSRGVGTKFFDEDAHFTLQFHLTNFCLTKAGICGEN